MDLRRYRGPAIAAALVGSLGLTPAWGEARQAGNEVVPPQVLVKTQRAPIFPPAAHAARFSGSVVVRATILVDGTVGEAVVVESNHPNVGFEQAALDAVKQWRFRPALLRGDPVEYTTQYRLNFDRQRIGGFGGMMAYASIEDERGLAGGQQRPGGSDKPQINVTAPRGDKTVPSRK